MRPTLAVLASNTTALAATLAALAAAKEEARALGRLEAESFDRRLREIEQDERSSRLERIVNLHLAAPDAGREVREIRSQDTVRLQREIDRMAEFHRLLLTSRSWRFLQFLRRPFGRAW